VSHDATDTLGWADELLVLRRGQLVQRGTPQQLYQEPASAYVGSLLGDFSLLHGPDRPGSTEPGTALLLRPEQLRLGAAEAPGLPGRVRAVRYQGSHYEVEVQLAVSVVRVPATTPQAVGDACTVALTAPGWPVPEEAA
jgi:iron(III) transport system ATP-binding protein